MEDVEKETIEEKENKVLFPEIHTTEVKFLDNTIEVRPLPIGVSKKIANYTSSINKAIDELGKLQKKGKSLDEIEQKIGNMDALTIDQMVKIVVELSKFYKLKDENEKEFSIEYIEDNATTDELTIFIKTQLNIMRENDFLLKPLSIILKMTSMDVKQMMDLLIASESTPDSVKSGDVLLNS